MSALLSCRGLSVAYRTRAGDVMALRDVDLTIAAGETVGLIGASGSGKSTLALAAVRYLGHAGRVAAGHILFEDRDIAELDAEGLRDLRGHGIGMVYQDPSAVFNPTLRIGAQVAEAADLRGVADSRAAAVRALAGMRIAEPERIAAAYPHQVSGGQLQRAVIAMALLGAPKLLILDEPTSSLDAATAADILDAVKDRAAATGAALLLISHDLGAVRRLCRRVEVLDGGRRVDGGPAEDLLATPRTLETRALADAWHGLPPAPARELASEVVLEIDGLGKRYGATGTPALEDVTLTVRAGETLAVVGESGAGKSTLGAIVAGIVSASAGSVHIDGKDVATVPARRRPADVRAAVRMVFQNPAETLNPAYTVRRQLARALRVGANGASAADLLKIVGLDEAVLDRRPGQLSGGQQQRVAIARALAARPKLIVADEPTSALDPVARNAVLAAFRSARDAGGTAFLFITHDMAAARAIADTVAVVRHGRIVALERAPAVAPAQ